MRRWIWALGAVVLAAAVGGVVVASLPNLAPDDAGPQLGANGTIAYGAGGNIRAVNPDGTGDERVVGERGDLAYQACPLYSPDGSLIAHHAAEELIIHHVDPEGHPAALIDSFVLPLEGNLNEDCGQWSASGRFLTVASADAFGETEQWLVVAASGSPPIVSVPVKNVAWGPDDTLSWALPRRVVIASTAGEVIRELTLSGTPIEFAWSPDGRNFAFTAVLPDENFPQLFLISSDGSNELQLTHGDQSVNIPVWSSDGRKLAYVIESCTPIGCSRRLGVFDGAETFTLPEPDITGLVAGEIVDIRWAPDAKSLLYLVTDNDVRGTRFGLIMIPTNGASPYLVANESIISSFDWQRR